MSRGRELFVQYLQQRDAMHEGPVVLSHELRRMTSDHDNQTVPASDNPAGRPAERLNNREGGRTKGGNWQDGAPEVPGPGIVVAPPAGDLFTADELAGRDLEGVAELVHSCTRCQLSVARANAVPGEGLGGAKLVVVGEGPGAKEDETGRPFVGRAGELLAGILKSIGLSRDEVYICNVVKCRPPSNRKPQQEEIEQCVPYLHRQLEIIGPKVILAMGGTAAETLLNTKQSLGSMRNKVHSFRGTPLVVTYHPAALLRNPNWKKPTWDDVRIARQLVDR